MNDDIQIEIPNITLKLRGRWGSHVDHEVGQGAALGIVATPKFKVQGSRSR